MRVYHLRGKLRIQHCTADMSVDTKVDQVQIRHTVVLPSAFWEALLFLLALAC